MITAANTVAEALTRRPELLQILPAFHPAFSRLQNPLLRRIMPRLVTVADAARIAGVEVGALLDVMNCIAVPPSPAMSPDPAPPAPEVNALPIPPDAAVLDARPLLDGGQDPLAAILGAVRSLSPGGMLTVIAPFEPVPLIGLLGRQGWDAAVIRSGATFCVTFSRTARSTHGAGGAHSSTDTDIDGIDGGGAEAAPGGWALDVRTLPPPQPMQRVLAAVDAGRLPLRVRHEREPALLWPHLETRGLAWTVEAQGGEVIIHVRRP